VKALTLNNRQMTLSTFRQLLEEDSDQSRWHFE
jgi:hypothetical protein